MGRGSSTRLRDRDKDGITALVFMWRLVMGVWETGTIPCIHGRFYRQSSSKVMDRR